MDMDLVLQSNLFTDYKKNSVSRLGAIESENRGTLNRVQWAVMHRLLWVFIVLCNGSIFIYKM